MTDALPLSAGQAEIWFDEKLNGRGVAYNSAGYLDIRGPLDVPALVAAARGLVDEAECTRTRYLEVDGAPAQVVTPLVTLPLTRLELTADEAADWMSADLATPFELDEFPLFRFAVVKVADDRHFFYMRIHHLLCDGYSQVVFWRRLAELYGGVDGTPIPPLSALLAGERAYEESPAAVKDKDFWSRRFDATPDLVSLSTRTVTDPEVRGFLRRTSVLSAGTARALRDLATRSTSTWPAVVLSAVAAYTQRLTGVGDVLLTLPATARMGATMRAVPGMVANYLPLRVRVRPDDTRPDLLRRTSRELMRVLKHQRHRVSRIRRAMGLAADDRRPFGPFVNILPQQTTFALGACEVEVNNLSTGLIEDLMITVVDAPDGGLEVHLNGNPELYTAGEAEAHLARFTAFLDRFAHASDDEPLAQLEVLADTERAEWLTATIGPSRTDPFTDVVEQVRAIAAERPDAVAVVEDDFDVTYSTLVARASALSRRLPATLVGVLAAPGAGFVSAVLGALGAGAAYVPLDTRAPIARTAELVRDNGIGLVVVDAAHRASAAGLGVDIIVLDNAEDTEPAPVLGDPDDLAYVIFTSGSTGKPKGAMVHRRGMVNHLLAKVEDLGLTDADSVVQNAPLTFDISVWQMLAPLVAGGRVRVVGRETAADPDLLFGLVADERITVLEVVPSLLRAALDAWDVVEARPKLPSLRELVVTGEALPPDLCLRWFARFPTVPLVNAYGPTECSDDVTHAFVTVDDAAGPRVPIGRAVRNTDLYVLGDDLGPVPTGVPGELYVGGAGVGRGYLGDPKRTSATFVADPFSGGRMYRTGDRVVRREDGQLEFLERRDHQVKVRGHRIELGEIEATLRGLPEVSDAAVQVVGEAGGKRLIGYVVANRPLGDLRVRLGELLPDYLVPSAFVELDAMPLTAHGKVDRKALPAPDVTGTRARAPRSPRERVLCEVMAEVLGLRDVGVDDDFFTLGGDSISSIQVVSRARRAGVVFTSREVMKHRTPAAIAAIAANATGTAVVADDGVGEVELTPIAHQLREDLNDLSQTTRQYSQYVVLHVPTGLDLIKLAGAIQTVVDHHDALRARLSVPLPGLWTMETLPVGEIRATKLVRRVPLSELDDVDEVVAEEVARARAGLAPEEGRVLQAVLIDSGTTARLVLVVHHLVVDGVSWRIIVPDLAEAVAGRALQPIGTSYRRWAKVLAEHARSASRVTELPLWAAQVHPTDVRLGDRPLDPHRDTYGTARSLRLVLPTEQTSALLTKVPAVFHAEINDVLLAGLAIAVADWRRRRLGVDDSAVLVEVEGHGREQVVDDVDLSRTVGWFTSVFPLRLDVGELDRADLWAGGASAGTAIKRVKEQLRALPDHGIGFGLLRYLNPQTVGTLARFGTPQVGFNYLGRFGAGETAGEWSLDAGTSVVGTGVSPDMPLRHAIAVTPVTEDTAAGPHLVADWLWADGLLSDGDVADIARTWFRALEAFVEHACLPGAGGHSPSDFDLVALTEREIADIERETGAVQDVLPLSPLQKGLLFQAEFDRDGADVYTLQVVVDVEGALDVDAFRAAAEALLRRHPNLRASFHSRPSGDAVQVVPASAALPWEEIDLTGMDPVDAEHELRRLTDEDWVRRFDMADPPLLRFTVVRTGIDRFRLIWAVHHILVDGWSMPIFAKELFTLTANGADLSALPPVAPSRDYLEWLARQDDEAARQAWRTALHGIGEATRIGPDERPRVTDSPASITVDLPAEFTGKLSRWARARGLTLNTVMQGAWAILLGRLTGRDDVVFGAVHSGRPVDLPGMESMVGLFLNTLPVRVRLDPATPIADLLTRIQDEQFDLAPHHHLGLAEVQQVAGVGELFDTVVSFHNYPMDTDGLSGIVPGVRLVAAEGRLVAEYPFALSVYPGDRLRLLAQYRSDIFDAPAIESVVDRFTRLLHILATDSDTPVAHVDLLSADERSQILDGWGGRIADIPEVVVTDLFEARAAEAPDSVAAVFQGTPLTYAELNARANRLARMLVARGAGPESVVALAMPRSLEMLVAVLGVLKAGASYLPIDAKYPADRVDYMVADARPSVLLSTVDVAGTLNVGVEVVPIDAVDFSAYPDGDLTDAHRIAPLRPHHPSYVIYTSGSTGKPKGVVVDHAGFVAMVLSLIDKFQVTPDTRVLQFASYSFDATVWEMGLALCGGGTVVVAGDDARGPGQALIDLINDNGVNLAALPPVVAGGMPEGTKLPDDLTMVVAGEACPPEVVARWSATHRMFNGYGPTESVLAATVGGPLTPGPKPPIGTPTAAHRVYVLDSLLQPVPAGVTGELYVSGGLARGYLNRPGLTAERFIADPFGGPGDRMYRTGDLVKWLPGGQLDYLGRADDQVQLRGFRIELGEVESVLLAHPDVVLAVAVVREDEEGDRKLVAYLVTGQDGSAVPAGLREQLVEALPEYMVPSALVVLDELPLTPQGKLDRKALPAPDYTGQTRGRGPRNPVEEILAGVFADVLQLPQVGIDDDFFALGGHSLLATKVISRARAALGVELPIRALFEARTVAGVAEQVVGASDARPPLRPAARGERIPLSYAQTRLWFLDKFEDGTTGTYNVPLAVRLNGDLDVPALRGALRDLVARHEILRSVFPDAEGEPYQQVVDVPADYPELPLTRLPESDLQTVLTAEADHGFDLAAEPVMRAHLYGVAPSEHVLLLVFHHIAFDGGSIAPLVEDLATAYRARVAGRRPEWAALAVQYADYALWQRELLGDEHDPDSLLSRQLGYWTQALAGVPEELDLPTDFARPAVGNYDGDELRFEIDAELYHAVVALARDTGASVFMVFQAALSALLTKLGAGTDIPLGTPTAGRTDDELADLIGFFVNTLVLRTDTGGDPTFQELLHRVRDTNLAAYQHQDVPFEHLVDRLNPERSLNKQPLFQVMLTMQTSDDIPLTLPGLSGRVEPVRSQRAKFDFTVLLEERYAEGVPSGMHGVLEYSTELFTEASARRLSRRLVDFLRSVVTDPAARLSRIDVLDADEHAAVLRAGTGPVKPQAYEGVVERVRSLALAQPDAVAVVDDHSSVTYAELVGRAGAFSRRVPGDGLTAVLAAPGIGFVTAVLGVLGAGGGYVPLDVQAPVARIAALLADSGARAIAVDEAHLELAQEVANGIEIVVLDDTVDAELPPAQGEPDDLAYVIFTSGSTGKPKGAMVHRRGMVNHLWCKVDDLAVSELDMIVHNAPVTFDISVWQMLTALMVGGRVRVTGRDTAVDPNALFATIRNEGVTILEVVPSLLRAALDAWDITEETPDLRGLRWLVVTGEALPPDLCHRWFARYPDIPLVNAYGPTECSDDVTHATIRLGDELGDARVPIGRPVRNTRLYVLGDDLRPVPAGVPGELYVGGIGVGRGYLNDRARTSVTFIADPYGDVGTRMYRTGDRVVLRPDGQLEFLERRDHQVKIRGHRIELGEVEAALRAVPEVGDAAVSVSGDQGGHKRLVGYVVAAPGADLSVSAVRDALGESLPDYMVPAAMVVLDALPLTPNGKVDRKALPEPDLAATRGRGPRTPVEEILCGVFGEVLGTAEVGVEDDFFDLGGHSLLATRVVSRIRTVLDVELPVRALFEARTVAGLAKLVAGAASARPALRPVERAGDEGLPLSFAQRRLWFLNKLEESATGTYNIPLAVRLKGELDVTALGEAVDDVVARNEILRTVFPDVDGVPYQRVLPVYGSVLRVGHTDDIARTLAEEVDRGFDLGAEPALRARLYVVDEQEHVLLLVFHHIAFDGWSTAPLARDLATAYAARRTGKAPSWEPLPVQYADYAVWQREWLGSETDEDSVLSAQLAYWTRALADLPEELDLPTDFARSAVSDHDGDVHQFSVPPELHAGLLALARETGASVFMLVQAAVSALLTKLGAGTDIPLGSPIAGRTDEALHDMVGFFVNTLVLRTDTSGDPTFRELVRRVRETDLAAYVHQDLPFEYLVEALNPPRSLSRHPLFQVMLAFQNDDDAAEALPGVNAAVEPMKAGRSKFDLTFDLVERQLDGNPAGMDGVLAYRTDLFRKSTVDRMAQRLIRVLTAVVADPDAPLSDVDVLSPDERHRILVEWNDTTRELDRALVPDMVANRTKQIPGVTALVGPDGQYTYRQLGARSNRLARELIRRGAGPERIVAIAVPRSTDLVVSALAVLKSGAAFLPIDPAHPADRIALTLADAEPTLTVTTAEVAAKLPPTGEVLLLDAPEVDRVLRGRGGAAEVTDKDRNAPLRPEHPAYVIYTSGSTGRPKGVVIPHRALRNLIADMRLRLAMSRDDRLLAVTTFGFDISNLEVFVPLVSGATLIVADREVVRDPLALGAMLVETRTSVMQATPSLWQALVDADPDALRRLRVVMTGGEALSEALAAALHELTPDVRNMYGPTETTIWSTVSEVDGGKPTIGKPISNTKVYVLDHALRPVPPGVPGELYIGGEGLARGYLNRTASTADRFLADPFGEAGDRMYRTGDVVRWDDDGEIEFLGRRDHQVKVRGFRIELGEVEAALRAVPGISDAVVVADNGRLVGYVVGSDVPEPVVVRRRLGEALPDHMIPSALVALERFPLNTNGKVDRAALPAPDSADRTPSRAPATAAEKVLCQVFADVLGLPEVRVDDDFFELGGHSLLATGVVSRARKAGLRFTIADVFVHKTTEGLASVAQEQDVPAAGASAVARVFDEVRALEAGDDPLDPFAVVLPIRPDGTKPPLFVLHSGLGSSLPYVGLARSIDPDVPIYGIQSPSVGHLAPLPDSIEAVAREYLGYLKQVQAEGPYHLLGWSFGGVLAQELAVRLQDNGDEVALVANLDGYPHRPGTEDEDLSDDELLLRVMEVIGHDREEFAGRDLQPGDVVEVLRRDRHPLADLGEQRLLAMLSVVRNHGRIMERFTPRTFHGDLVLFAAVRDRSEAEVAELADSWTAHVGGEVRTHRVPCGHEYMMHPEPQALIGAAVAEELRRVQGNQIREARP
ncbi:amino acid adenylation domain-containing protein/non-ribosomal peptide synthase protein (TIGR01720 family) [Saccharothrix tamanrassetensis]|uniref:Amino acid adenylation domain-containing protein/non-ribosomal peptide synthase protein (TIGR01720 family) n=1 Tax=Saccharothrix tamanrassetensis TaxID=1051531 RepID=A0A841CAM9_9PSEU|nr:non-ribosomal peptide synthetase [Saccharothrix tamanrassetensis]MBB5954040.1 amino acid adenylation domain-containing protein/non-ribosomal peptide synthase protein (TIGR01720 family) [Saccharothrix tamanrassetensis]